MSRKALSEATKVGIILFSPRNAAMRENFERMLTVLSSQKSIPSSVQISDLAEAPQAVFHGLEIAIERGFSPKILVPHLSMESARFRMSENRFDKFAGLGVKQVLLLSGVAKNHSPTRQEADPIYNERMLGDMKEVAQQLKDHPKLKVRLTFYPEGHVKARELSRHCSPDEAGIIRHEMDILVKKILLLCEITNREPGDLISGIVFQHSLTPQVVAIAHEKLKQFFEEIPIPILPTILPLGSAPDDLKLFKAFNSGGNIASSVEVEKVVGALEAANKAKDQQEVERLEREASTPLSIDIALEFKRLFSPGEILLYAGHNPQILGDVLKALNQEFSIPNTDAKTVEVESLVVSKDAKSKL